MTRPTQTIWATAGELTVNALGLAMAAGCGFLTWYVVAGAALI